MTQVSASAGHPRFITLEGGEGAGKSTVLHALRVALQADGKTVICTREPGGTPLAERIRTLLLLPGDELLAAETELLLMFAARSQHARQVIVPALQRGEWVLCDRFTDSSHAYQGGGRGLPTTLITQLEQGTVPVQPGLTLLLDVDPELGLQRTVQRGEAADRIESEQLVFFRRVREAFLQRARAEPQRFRVIDASADAASVAMQAVQHLLRHREQTA